MQENTQGYTLACVADDKNAIQFDRHLSVIAHLSIVLSSDGTSLVHVTYDTGLCAIRNYIHKYVVSKHLCIYSGYFTED